MKNISKALVATSLARVGLPAVVLGADTYPLDPAHTQTIFTILRRSYVEQ